MTEPYYADDAVTLYAGDLPRRAADTQEEAMNAEHPRYGIGIRLGTRNRQLNLALALVGRSTGWGLRRCRSTRWFASHLRKYSETRRRHLAVDFFGASGLTRRTLNIGEDRKRQTRRLRKR